MNLIKFLSIIVLKSFVNKNPTLVQSWEVLDPRSYVNCEDDEIATFYAKEIANRIEVNNGYWNQFSKFIGWKDEDEEYYILTVKHTRISMREQIFRVNLDTP